MVYTLTHGDGMNLCYTYLTLWRFGSMETQGGNRGLLHENPVPSWKVSLTVYGSVYGTVYRSVSNPGAVL